jgi:hypothetical protein
MKNKVHITEITINRKGQIHHFQMQVPSNAKHIVAVELGGHLLSDKIVLNVTTSPTRFKRNTLVGELKLQSCERANIFYAGNLSIDNNLGYGDFSQSTFWKPKAFTHQSKVFQDTVFVNAESTIIQGVYKDLLGKEKNVDVSYKVKVYVWYSK